MKDNKLIAEFMGWDIESPTTLPSNLHLSNLEIDNNEVLEYKFHTSWDWLMPVISKIVEDYGEGWSFEEGYDLEVRYQSVVNFIKECNDEKN